MEEREPKLIVAVGRKGCGKTFSTMKMLNSYVQGNPTKGVKPRRVLIFDVNDEFEGIKALHLKDVGLYSVHPKVEIRRIRPFNQDGTPMGINEMQEALFKIVNNFRGGMLLLEDLNGYVGDYIPQDLIGKIVRARHADLDIITHFQSIGRISPKIWQNVNAIRFHKNTDSVLKHAKKFDNFAEMFLLVEAYVNSEYHLGNERVQVWVDTEKEKIKIPKNNIHKFEKIVEDYLMENHKRILNPLLKKNAFFKNKKELTMQEVLQTKKAEMLKYYLD